MLQTIFRLQYSKKVFILFARHTQILNRHFCDDKSKKSDLYEALGLKSNATQSEIKKAYYDLTFKHHPDRNEGSVSASKKFREVTEAYEVLGNYGLRKRYDKGLPLPQTKKVDLTQNIVEPTVKYQSFFDSRTHKQNDKKFTPLGEEPEIPPNQKSVREEEADKAFESSLSQQTLVAAFIIVLVILVTRYSS